MATWGAHFRIAENLLKTNLNLNRKSFAIGNIGPDCGLPNKNWSVFTPPKDVSHFAVSETSNFLEVKSDSFILNDIKFFLKYLVGYNKDSFQSKGSFLLGYFIHIITDNQWNYHIMRPLKEKYSPKFENNQNFIWEVKKDWYDLDKIYITEKKDSLFWTDFLYAEYKEDFIDLLPREGILRQLEFIKQFYQISNEEYSKISAKEFKYMKKEKMDSFIQDSCSVILDVLTQIFEGNFQFKGKISVLEGMVVWG